MNSLLGTCRDPIYESVEVLKKMFSYRYFTEVLGDLHFSVMEPAADSGILYSYPSWFPLEIHVSISSPALWWCWARPSQNNSLLLPWAIKWFMILTRDKFCQIRTCFKRGNKRTRFWLTKSFKKGQVQWGFEDTVKSEKPCHKGFISSKCIPLTLS